MRSDSPITPPASNALLAATLLRIAGTLLAVVALWQLVGNVADSFFDFDPSYLGYFFWQQLFRPLVGGFLGLLLCLFAKPLGKLCDTAPGPRP